MSNRGSVTQSYEYISVCSHTPSPLSRFALTIRQQPVQARQSTTNERDRRPVDPPPIVQISLRNATTKEIQDFLQNPYYFMFATLAYPAVEDHPQVVLNHKALSGQTVSSMYKLKDVNNNDGGFFVFGDLSVRLEGRFRLQFSLFQITTQGAAYIKSIFSDIFTVYSAKNFPGMLESTFLSRSFSDQGVRLRIRKEHRVQISGSRKRKMSAVDNEPALSPSTTHRSGPQYMASPTDAYVSYAYLRQHQQHQPSACWYWPPPEDTYQQQRRRESIISTPEVTVVTQDRFSGPRRHSSYHLQQQYPRYDFHMPSPPPSAMQVQHDLTNKVITPFSAASSSPHPFAEDISPIFPPATASYGRRSWSFSVSPPSPLLMHGRRLSDDDVVTPATAVRLPPIRNILTDKQPEKRKDSHIVEVDAAVAMMQLASNSRQIITKKRNSELCQQNERPG